MEEVYKEFDNLISKYEKENDPKMKQISNKPDMLSWKKFNYDIDSLAMKFQFELKIPFDDCYSMGIDLSIREQWDSKFYGYELLEVK